MKVYHRKGKIMNEQKSKIFEILYQQIQLLAEESAKTQDNDNGWKSGLTEYSDTICHLTNAYVSLLNTQEQG
jgi:hypothetical protein